MVPKSGQNVQEPPPLKTCPEKWSFGEILTLKVNNSGTTPYIKVK